MGCETHKNVSFSSLRKNSRKVFSITLLFAHYTVPAVDKKKQSRLISKHFFLPPLVHFLFDHKLKVMLAGIAEREKKLLPNTNEPLQITF